MLTIYKASAGSGKTYTLAKNYITCLLGLKPAQAEKHSLNLVRQPDGSARLKLNYRHRGILAITFTRKATEEMKTRIVNELKCLSAMPAPGQTDPSKYAPDLMDEMGCSRADLAEAAALALQQLLYDYGNFNVSTIDSFFQRVLHAFARELDLQGEYDIRLDDKGAMRESVAAMLDDFNVRRNEHLEGWLVSFMTDSIASGRKSNFFNRSSRVHTELVGLLSRISDEKFKPFAKDMREYLATGNLIEYTRQLHAYARSTAETLCSRARDLFADQAKRQMVQSTRIRDVLDLMVGKGRLPKSLSPFKSSNFATALCERGSGQSPYLKAPTKRKDGTYAPRKPLSESEAVDKAFFEDLKEGVEGVLAVSPVIDSLTQLGLLQYAWQYLDRLKRENNLLLLSDTNDLLSRVIGDDQTPFVYERMGVELKHFLIDEFQDTSQMQWDNLSPLIDNSMHMEWDNDCLVIGDEKQSIYRFRNSNSDILHSQVQAAFPGRCDMVGTTADKNTNYRSSADVVRFNNTLFAILSKALGVPGYENVVQGIKADNLGFKGHVAFYAVDATNKDDFTEKVLDDMAKQIRRLADEGKYKFSDIAILANTNSQAETIVEYLVSTHSRDIPVLSDEALRLASSHAVQLVISILRLLDSEQAPQKAEPGKKRYPTHSEVMQVLNRFEYYAEQPGLTPAQALEKAAEPLVRLLNGSEGGSEGGDAEMLSMGVDAIRRRRPADLVALIEAVIDTQFPDPAARQPHSAYLAALLDTAIDFSERDGGSLHAFLTWWNANGKKINIGGSSEADAVRVMTIHKSKGLEFPCVLVPFCTWTLTWTTKTLPQIWTADGRSVGGIDPALAPPALFIKLDSKCNDEGSPFKAAYDKEVAAATADTLNKTYVAFTRAKSELLVWYYKQNAGYIGKALAQALKAGMPNPMPADTPASLLVDLRSGLLSDTDCPAFELGEPTVRDSLRLDGEQNASAGACEKMSVGYPVHFHPELASIMQLDDPMELGTDTDDRQQRPLRDPRAPMPEPLADGIAMHEIMARITVPSDLDRAVASVCSEMRATAEKRSEYAALARAFMADERVASWFSPSVTAYAEQPIYLPAPDVILRPDRVVVFPDGTAHVIDYKFSDEDHSVCAPAHLQQVSQYMGLVAGMVPGQVRGFLCYPRLGRIAEVGADGKALSVQ